MKVLVTGASGFIGNSIACDMASAGHEVLAMTRHQNGQINTNQTNLKYQKLKYLCYADLSKKALEDIEVIVHAAALSPDVDVLPTDMIDANINFTKWVIDQTRSSKISFVIFLSSISCFGKISSSTLHEATPLSDISVYGLTKLIGERLFEAEKETFPTLNIRLPGVVGKGSKRNWLTKVAHAYSTGSQLIYFNPDAYFNNILHVNSLNRFILDILERREFRSDTLVLGSKNPVQISEIFNIFEKISGSRVQLVEIESDQTSFLIDNTKAAEVWHFNPEDTYAAIERFALETLR